MPTLFVLGGKNVGISYEVTDGMVLGRHPDCTVQIVDRSVSRQHARLEAVGDSWVVVDLGSRNGVRVRGERVERAELHDRDEILLGELPLRFRHEQPAPEAPRPEPAPAPAPAPPPPPRHRRTAAPSETEEGGGLDLEEEIDLEALGQTRETEAPAGVPRPAPLTARDEARARILGEGASRGGILGGDLAQRPLWVRALVYLLVLVVAVVLFGGAFLIVQKLRGSL